MDGKKSRILIKPRALEFKEYTPIRDKRCDKTIVSNVDQFGANKTVYCWEREKKVK